MSDTELKVKPLRKRRNKRVQQAIEVLQETGHNPFQAMVRIAIKCEKEKQYNTAGALWKEIAQYVQPKYKAIDPVDQAMKAHKVMTLDDISRMKEMIKNGEVPGLNGKATVSTDLL